MSANIDALRGLLDQLPGLREDPHAGDAVFRCGFNGALDVIEGRIRAALAAAPAATQGVPVEMGHGTVAVGTCKRSTDGVPGIVYLRIPGDPRSHDTDCGDIYPVGSPAPESSVLACVYFLTAETLQQSIDVLRELQAAHYPHPHPSGDSGDSGQLAGGQQDARDAARYRLVRRGQHWSVVDGIGDDLRAEALDAAVDRVRAQGGGNVQK